MDYSFHISRATLDITNDLLDLCPNLVSVHALVDDTDYLLCYLGQSKDGNLPILQQTLNLEVTEGENITLYIKQYKKTFVRATVHLTGYFTGTYEIAEAEQEDKGALQEEEEEEEEVEGFPRVELFPVKNRPMHAYFLIISHNGRIKTKERRKEKELTMQHVLLTKLRTLL